MVGDWIVQGVKIICVASLCVILYKLLLSNFPVLDTYSREICVGCGILWFLTVRRS
jgi:hypothetical protein